MRNASRSYLLAILTITLAFNAKDRLLFGIALQDIKQDLALSDTQLGLLAGLAFAVFHALMGLPIARWSDRGNRVTVLAVCTALWSAAVTLCGLAANFWQMLAMRICVAVGEAGCDPPAHSLIADHYSRPERPRAVAIYRLGLPLSALLGYFVAGWIIEHHGWRAAFAWLGSPGILLAALAWLTLRDPRTSRAHLRAARSDVGSAIPSPDAAELTHVARTLWHNISFRQLVMGFSVMSVFSTGLAQWQAAFFMRTHGMSAGELGTWFAVAYGGIGLLSTYVGGALASRYLPNDEAAQLLVAARIYAIYGAVSGVVFLLPDARIAILVSGLATMGTFAVSGPLFATIQTLVPNRMRATALALLTLFVSLVGGVGPLATGYLSDVLRPALGDASLQWALIAMSPGYVWVGWHYWRASRTVLADIARVANSEPPRADNETPSIALCASDPRG